MARAHVPRVFVDAPLTVGDTIALDDAKRHHLGTVLRLATNAKVTLFNGSGREYGARVADAGRKHMRLALESEHEPRRESPLDLTLVQAIARGDRMDFAVAKAVELGVTRIRPVFTDRGKVRLEGARLEKKQAHWQSVAESAAEQSGRLIRPAVGPAIALTALLDETRSDDATGTLRLMLAPNASGTLSEHESAARVELLIGPESGLSEREIEIAGARGWRALGLGPRVLRTETAGMAALAAIQTRWGDLAG